MSRTEWTTLGVTVNFITLIDSIWLSCWTSAPLNYRSSGNSTDLHETWQSQVNRIPSAVSISNEGIVKDKKFLMSEKCSIVDL